MGFKVFCQFEKEHLKVAAKVQESFLKPFLLRKRCEKLLTHYLMLLQCILELLEKATGLSSVIFVRK